MADGGEFFVRHINRQNIVNGDRAGTPAVTSDSGIVAIYACDGYLRSEAQHWYRTSSYS